MDLRSIASPSREIQQVQCISACLSPHRLAHRIAISTPPPPPTRDSNSWLGHKGGPNPNPPPPKKKSTTAIVNCHWPRPDLVRYSVQLPSPFHETESSCAPTQTVCTQTLFSPVQTIAATLCNCRMPSANSSPIQLTTEAKLVSISLINQSIDSPQRPGLSLRDCGLRPPHANSHDFQSNQHQHPSTVVGDGTRLCHPPGRSLKLIIVFTQS